MVEADGERAYAVVITRSIQRAMTGGERVER
jgi:hypothetical protein